MQIGDEVVWIEWKEDAETLWAEVYGVHPITEKIYAGDTLVVFDRIFGKWYCREFRGQEFTNSRSAKNWTKKLLEACEHDVYRTRNHSKAERNRLNGTEECFL